MENMNYTITGKVFSVTVNEALIPQAQILFRAIQTIPVTDLKDGYKLEIGFSVFIFAAHKDGYKIVVPDYLNSPFINTTDDLTIALWVLFEQTELLKTYGIEGVPTRFDDAIYVAEKALQSKMTSLQRHSDLAKGSSGWCLESLEEKDGRFQTVGCDNYESLYTYQLIQKHPGFIKALVLPYDYIVVFNEKEIVEILNEKDESVLNSNKP